MIGEYTLLKLCEKYINDNSITLPMVSKYCTFFPDYVSKRVLGGSLIGILTQQ